MLLQLRLALLHPAVVLHDLLDLATQVLPMGSVYEIDELGEHLGTLRSELGGGWVSSAITFSALDISADKLRMF